MRVFSDLLHNRSLEKEEILRLVSFKNWDLGYFYRICVFTPSALDLSDHILGYFCHCLMMEFAGCLAMHEGGRIVAIFCLGRERGFLEEYEQKLRLFTRETDLRIGMSDDFCGLDALPVYYKEAVIALSYGTEQDPDIWCHTFQDYALDHILDRCSSSLPLPFLCAREIRVLREYDVRNNTDLNLTLKTYLRNDQNAVRTAKELYIQRGTLKYRIKRIRELTGLHFEDKERLLYISISYALGAKYLAVKKREL